MRGHGLTVSMYRSIAALGILTFSCAAIAQEKPEAGTSKDQLRGVEQKIERSTFEQQRLAFEIENLSAEAQKIRTGLIELTAKVRASEDRVGAAEARLEDIAGREVALRRSLQARERVSAEVLAAMQRIGRKPPPAVLVSPEDALGAVRAAILLGAVLPDMRDEALVLIADLKSLMELRREAVAGRDRLAVERDQLSSERERLASLVDARQGQLTLSRAELGEEKVRIASLLRDARSLRDLISRSDTEIIGSARAAEIARRAPAPQRSAIDVASLKPDATRLTPRLAFAELRGKLQLPVSGVIARAFGQSDGLGSTEKGITILSQKQGVVTALADGWIHFAAPYRGYGHLLIINAGSGYHVVMAGLERLTIEVGQFVLAGEPIGFLGTSPAIQPGESVATSRPALYVEFRKDGSPVDPSPWWSTNLAEKARG